MVDLPDHQPGMVDLPDHQPGMVDLPGLKEHEMRGIIFCRRDAAHYAAIYSGKNFRKMTVQDCRDLIFCTQVFAGTE
jgi:hypothetical protein